MPIAPAPVIFIKSSGARRIAMTDRITSLSKELVETTDFEESRRIARELQNAIRERVENLHEQLRRIPKDDPESNGAKNMSGRWEDFGRMAA